MSDKQEQPTQKDINLFIWEQTRKTDKKFCKDFKGKGGFQGTAIDPIY